MQNESSHGNGKEAGGDLEAQEGIGQTSIANSEDGQSQTVLAVVVSDGETLNQVRGIPEPTGKEELASVVDSKKADLSRTSSFNDECRICQQDKEEDLIDLGCQCRGGLARAHRSCIDAWFCTRGSNICEICQQVAANVTPPESLPSANYWVWRLDSVFRRSHAPQQHERGCCSPLWVAFSILIGGLLLDVLISITLGISALPVNIIIGVIVVLGLGTALRLALEFCREWSLRRVAERVENNVNLGYPPAL